MNNELKLKIKNKCVWNQTFAFTEYNSFFWFYFCTRSFYVFFCCCSNTLFVCKLNLICVFIPFSAIVSLIRNILVTIVPCRVHTVCQWGDGYSSCSSTTQTTVQSLFVLYNRFVPFPCTQPYSMSCYRFSLPELFLSLGHTVSHKALTTQMYDSFRLQCITLKWPHTYANLCKLKRTCCFFLFTFLFSFILFFQHFFLYAIW